MSGPALLEHCVNFCRALRMRGIEATPRETLLAARTLGLVDIGDRQDVRLGLRAVLILTRHQYAIFDEVFAAMWGTASESRDAPSSVTSSRSNPPDGPRSPHVTLQTWMRGDDPAREERVPIRAASAREARGPGDLSGFDHEESAAFARLARQAARRLAMRPSRRWKPASRGARIDLRRTIRGAVPTGGELARLEWRRRKIRRTRLVAIGDVSGSMEHYSRFLLQFLHALQNSFARIETFVFSTRLTRVTGLLRHASWERARAGVARDVVDWSGGTRIGASLSQFVDDRMAVVDRRTVVIILSDGWDTGEPEVLARAMQRIQAKAGRVIWLNPLMANPGYQPESRGMQAALPYIDLLASVHNIESLEQLLPHLAI